MPPVSKVSVEEVLRGVLSDEDLWRQTLLRQAGAGEIRSFLFKGPAAVGGVGLVVTVPDGVRWMGRELTSSGEISHAFTLQSKKPADAGFVDRSVGASAQLAMQPLRLYAFEFDEAEEIRVFCQRASNLAAYPTNQNLFQTLVVMEVKL